MRTDSAVQIIFEQLHREGVVSENSYQRIRAAEGSRLFSIYWEVRTLLYLGILLLTGGLGILIYKNIDTIGHQVVLAIIGIICTACFIYCERLKLPFSRGKVMAPNSFFDYILLLGCLTMLTFLTYLQVQYNVFGNAYGMATFIPMVILFFCAYHFDHLGVLSLAITNLGAWMGVAVTPLRIIKSNDFSDTQIILAGLVLGIVLSVAAEWSIRRNFKRHFSFTYLNFALNVSFVSCLAGMFRFEDLYLVWLLPLAAMIWYFYKKALAISSFYFVLMISLYSYVAVSYCFIRISDFSIFSFMYFIASGVLMVLLLINLNKNLKKNDRSQ